MHGRDQYSQLARNMRNLFYLVVATTLAGIGSATAQNYPWMPHNICDILPERCVDDVLTFLRWRFGTP